MPYNRMPSSACLRSVRDLVGAAALMLIAWAPQASAQDLRVRVNANGIIEVTNPITGRSAEIPPPSAALRNETTFANSPRERAYDDLIVEQARLNNVRPDLIRAVVKVESGFNPYAQSRKGAQGLMQLMPATARQYGVRNAFNPAENVRAGVAYLRGLLDRYKNNEELALAAYNAGPGAVDKHGQTVPPYRETRSYVARINQMAGRPATPRDQTIVRGTDVTADGRAIPSYSNLKH